MNFNYIKNSKKFFIFSAALMIAVVILSFVMGVELDIQFKGGALVSYAYSGDIDSAKVNTVVDSMIDENFNVQYGDDIATGENSMIISLPGNITPEEMSNLTDKLKEDFPDNNVEEVQSSNVDPTMGKEFMLKCVVALLVASVAMVVYTAIRFRKIGGWSAGVMALVALFHDVVVAYGVFVVLRIPINDNFIAVVLTILGFSLNDTIVIYDRIRENKGIMGVNTPVAELTNTSINQSFTRSVVTAVCAILTMAVVSVVAMINNVESILSFSLPMLVGLISGSYSTICLVGPLWVKWQESKGKKKKA